eukprot:5791480-Alexandrium_andersonii.AAC.1
MSSPPKACKVRVCASDCDCSCCEEDYHAVAATIRIDELMNSRCPVTLCLHLIERTPTCNCNDCTFPPE